MLLAFVPLALSVQAPAPADVLTSHNTPGRTGVNAAETALTPARVSAATFGKLWTLYADGQIVAQPLYVSKLAVETSANPATPRVQGTFNAVLIATMHNTVYLYDADHERPGPDGRTVPLWATWLGQPRPGGADIDMWAVNDPEWGILSTPVIDPAKSIVYVVAWHDDGGPDRNYHYRLHALRLKDGTHVAPPVALEAPGLNPRSQKQRTGLLLTGGDPVHRLRRRRQPRPGGGLRRRDPHPPRGLGLDPHGRRRRDLAGRPGARRRCRGQRLPHDRQRDLRRPDRRRQLRRELRQAAARGRRVRGQGLLHPLQRGVPQLARHGPWLRRSGAGSGRRLSSSAAARRGGSTCCPPPAWGNIAAAARPQPEDLRPNPNVLQDFQAAQGHLHGSPVFWEGTDGARVYVWGENDRLRAYRFASRRIVQTAKLSEYRPPDGMPGGMLSLSSSGRTGGILWAVVPLDGDANKYRGVKGIVLALDALDVSRTLWTSEQSGARDRLGLFARFVPPTVAGGKVFVATYGDDEPLRMYGTTVRPQTFPARYQVAVYGLLPEPAARVVNQSRDDVQLVRAAVGDAVTLDASRCRPDDAQSLDCTDELGRSAGAPSLERLIVPGGLRLRGLPSCCG